MLEIQEASPQIPGYRLIHRLGRGGQGQVWKAVRERDSRAVALKIIRIEHQHDAVARARFEYEYQVLSGEIDHPYIVKALDRGKMPTGEMWLATEYVSGRPIHEYANALDERGLNIEAGTDVKVGAFPVRALLKLFTGVCDAVEAAHRHGIIHRDLKPSNILVDDQHCPRLVDFGLAKPLAPRDTSLHTMTGQFVGTPPYAAPEQADPQLIGDLDQLASRQDRESRHGGSAVDVRSDIYSLGVILYELMTGESPYGVDSPSLVTREMILRQPPVPPREVAAHVDRDLEAVLLKALAKYPARRYQTVAEFRDDIDALLAVRPVQARGERLGYLLRTYVRRHRFAAVGIVVALLLTVLYAPFVTLLYRRANAARAKEAHNARVARETAEWVITQVDDKLKDTIGMGDLRLSILRDAYDKLEELSTYFEGDSTVDADLARSLTKLGDVACVVGKYEDAEKHRRAALAIWQTLVQREPENAEYLESLSIGQVLVGDILKTRNENDEALRLYQSSLVIDENLANRFPNNVTYLDNLAWSYERVGALAAPDNSARRHQCFTKRHELAKELVRREPNNLIRKLNLCASYLCMLSEGPMSSDYRIDMITSARDIADELIHERPLDGTFLTYYVNTNQRLCDAEMQYGRPLDACAERLDDIANRIASARAADPHNLVFLFLNATNLRVRAHLAYVRGNWANAIKLFEESADRYTESLTSSPDDPTFRGDAGLCAEFAAIFAYDPAVPTDLSNRAKQVVRQLLPMIASENILFNLPHTTTPEFRAYLAQHTAGVTPSAIPAAEPVTGDAAPTGDVQRP